MLSRFTPPHKEETKVKRIKHAITLASLVAISAIGLFGCGGETPTATAIPPTATTMVEAPTATTAAVVAPTSTTAQAESTATTASTGNTGGISGGSAADILRNSSKAMQGVKSFHIVLKTEAAGVSATGEGDFVLPDKARLTMDSGAAGKTQIILIGGSMYSQVPGSDAYLELPGGNSPLSSLAGATTMADLAENATVVGDETLDGVNTTHVKFTYSADKAMAMAMQAAGQATPTPGTSLGEVNADVWVEKSTGYVHQFKSISTIAGSQSNTTATYSKFNEDVTPPIEKPTNIQQMPTIPTIASP
jgi:LppX_LprAFG lipoprotein